MFVQLTKNVYDYNYEIVKRTNVYCRSKKYFCLLCSKNINFNVDNSLKLVDSYYGNYWETTGKPVLSILGIYLETRGKLLDSLYGNWWEIMRKPANSSSGNFWETIRKPAVSTSFPLVSASGIGASTISHHGKPGGNW